MIKLTKNQRVGEIIRFILVGFLATAIHYIIYYVLLNMLGHNLSYTVGYVVSFIFNFISSSLFTFRVKPSFQRLTGFGMSHLMNYFIGMGLLNVMIFLGVSVALAPLPVFVLQVPINFLLVRYSMICKYKDGYALFFLIMTAALIVLYMFEVPTMNDDMNYHFMFKMDMNDCVTAIKSVSDLLQSQWAHYFTVNGRMPVHLLAQTMLVFVPAWVYQLLNALLFVFLIYICVKWLECSQNSRLFGAVTILFLLLFVVKDVKTTFLWSLGAFNYLWVLVTTMCFLLWLRHVEKLPFHKHYIYFSPIAIIIGWSHEGLSLPLSIAFTYYLWQNRKGLLNNNLTFFLLFYIIGSLMIIISPAVWMRASEGITMKSRLISGCINILFNVRIGWLLLISLLVVWKSKPDFLRYTIINHRYVYVAWIAAMGIVLICGTNIDRVPFYADFIAMLLLLNIWIPLIQERWQKRLKMVFCGIMILCFVPVMMIRKGNYERWQSIEKQLNDSRRELISVPVEKKSNLLSVEYLKQRFVLSSVDFGFYSVYMAFDKNDLNMRCAASYYNKSEVVFLPEDVVRRILTDSTAYKHYATDSEQRLYIWQLPDSRPVKHIIFVLNKENLATLWPHQRLLAYNGDTYELDDFHYEVIEIANRHYLVFTRPTTNIVRRLHHIVYSY